MALGAGRREIVGMVMGEAVVLVTIGLAAGGALALAAGRAASTLLFHLKPYDPGTLLAAAAVLALIAAAASYLPARRATRVDPLVTLRDE